VSDPRYDGTPATPTDETKDGIVWRIVNLNPSIWRGVVAAVFVFLAALGIKVAPDIPDAAWLVVAAVIPLLQAISTRKAVTPNAKVVVRMPDPVNEPTKIEAGEAVVPINTDLDITVNPTALRVLELAGTKGV
jgi:hypothetical protein